MLTETAVKISYSTLVIKVDEKADPGSVLMETTEIISFRKQRYCLLPFVSLYLEKCGCVCECVSNNQRGRVSEYQEHGCICSVIFYL